MQTNDPREKTSPEHGQDEPNSSKTAKQQQSDPPLTEIKGVTDPEEYEEPEVEDESEDKKF
jgi:hypothetical protein